jgi:hypothetical protein
MATYRKLLKNRNGDIIIPVVDVLNYLYPVGSIYMSATMSTVAQVQTAFGGTWVKWGAGRVPVGVDPNDTSFDTVEETGGEKTHALGELEVPGFLWHTDQNTRDTLSININGGSTYGCKAAPQSKTGNAHNNLQPYITCYMYKRTA